MDMHIVRLGRVPAASLLISALGVIGCTTWQASLDYPIATTVSGASVSRMSADVQRIVVLQAIQNLHADFDRISNGAEWKKHLQLDTIQSLVDQPNNVPPDNATRERLVQIAQRFDTIANNHDYRMIHELSSFRTVQAALPEYAIDPVVRHGRIIAANVKLLSEELEGFSFGDGWNRFLRLEELTEFTRSPQSLTGTDRNALIEILTHFEKAKEGPEYVAVASAAGFDGAMRGLQHLVGDLRNDTSQTKPLDGAVGPEVDPRRYHVVELTNGEFMVIDRSNGRTVPDLRHPFQSSQLRAGKQHEVDQLLGRSEIDALPEPPTPETTGLVATSSPAEQQLRPAEVRAEAELLDQAGVNSQFALASTPHPGPHLAGANSLPKLPLLPTDSAADEAAVQLKFVPESMPSDAGQAKGSLPESPRPSHVDAPSFSTPTSDEAVVKVQFVSRPPVTADPDPAEPDSQGRHRSAPLLATRSGARSTLPSPTPAESRAEMTGSSRDLAPLDDRLRYQRDVKRELRAHIDELKNVINELEDDARVRVETIDRVPEYRPGRRLVTVWKRRSFSRAELAEYVSALQTRMEPTDTGTHPSDVEPPPNQQFQADLIQRIEKALMTLHEATIAK